MGPTRKTNVFHRGEVGKIPQSSRAVRCSMGVRAKEGTDLGSTPRPVNGEELTGYKPQKGHLEGDETDHHGYLVRNDSCCWDDPPKKWTWTSPTPPPPGSFVSLPTIQIRWICQVKNGWNGLQQGWRMPVFLILGDIQKRIYLWEKYGLKWSKLPSLVGGLMFFIWDERRIPSVCGQVLNGNKNKVISELGGPSQLDLSS